MILNTGAPIRSWIRDRVLALAIVTLVAAALSIAAPRSAHADWTEGVVTRLLGIQFGPECFKEPKYERHVHILGVEAGGVALPDVERSRLLNALSDKLSSGTRNRITVAPAFQFIAGSSNAFDTKSVIQMARLDEAARRAEVTILLRPLELTASEVNVEVVMWANDPTEGIGEYSCVRPFNVSVPIEVREDPRCTDGWSKAKTINTSDGYRFFTSFFGDCPQVGEAKETTRKLESEGCGSAWQQARARDGLEDYRSFVRDYGQCTVQVEAANAIISVLRRRESEPKPKPQVETPKQPEQPVYNPPQARATRSFHYVGPVNPPDDWLSLRTQPSSSSGRRILKMRENTPFTVVDRRGQWLQVQLLDGTIGWAHGNWIRCCIELAQ